MNKKTVLILGAKSDMALALAYQYSQQGYSLQLAARNVDNFLKDTASDIKIRFQVDVSLHEFDIVNSSNYENFYHSLPKSPEGVICLVGYLGDQNTAQHDAEMARKIVETNYTGPVSILNLIANDFEKRKTGWIIGISSVAGDRGRQSNYLYGSAKAGFTTFLSGLRARLSKYNVHVLTVKPGFVATAMTKDLELPPFLTAQPEQVAKDIYRAQQKHKNVIYTRWFWRWIMFIVKTIPENMFKKLNF